jgi:hypothetical protein
LVPPEELRNPSDLPGLDLTMRELSGITLDTKAAIKWLATYSLLGNTRNCQCGTEMRLQHRNGKRFVHSFAWACRSCNNQESRDLSSPKVILHCSSWLISPTGGQWMKSVRWQSDSTEFVLIIQLKIGFNFLRDICCQFFLDHPMQLGGSGTVCWNKWI